MNTQLADSFGRVIDYVRLSVTDRCDLRCVYCIPKGFRDFQEPADWLTFDEIERIIRAFGELGVRRVRITGGEPLTRRNLPELAGRLAALPGIEDLSLSTNAVQLAKHAAPLRQSGVTRINVSLDTLREDRFAAVTQGQLHKVLDGLMAAKAAGFRPIKINMVVMKGVNDDEIEEMLGFCIEHGFSLRFIETMPTGDTGRNAYGRYLDLQEVRQRLAETFELIPSVMPGGGPARYMRVAGTDLHIGFITPISQHFCATCNRVRIGVDGTLYLCLGQDHSVALGPLLRQGISDEGLKETLIQALRLKPERHEFRENPHKTIRIMSVTGG